MQQKITQALVLVGFVVATIGAAGFHSPTKSAAGEAMLAEGALMLCVIITATMSP